VKDTETGAEIGNWASFRYLDRLCKDRALSRKYGLLEMVNIAEFCDQKSDAAYKLISQDIISLLERRCPEDGATILAMKAMYYFTEPMLNEDFTDPFAITKWIWRGMQVMDRQQQYVRKLMGPNEIKAHCASPQFRSTMSIMAESFTNYLLMFHRHHQEHGLSWDKLGLCRANTDSLEGMHSEERCGNETSTGADWNVDLGGHLTAMTRLQQVYERKPILQAEDVVVGAPRHAQGSQHGIRSLGLPSGVTLHEIKYGGWSTTTIPEDFAEFVQEITRARDAGIKLGDEDYEHYCERTVAAMRNKSLWEDVSPRVVKARPAGFKPVISPDAVKTPPSVLLPGQFEASAHAKTALQKFEKDIEEGMQRSRGQIENDNEEGDPMSIYTEELAAITEKAQASKAAWRRAFANSGTKVEDAPLVASEEDVTSMNKVLTGTFVMDGDDYVRTSQVLRAFQYRESVDRDRGRRFWVGRLKDFGDALRDKDHDVLIGTVVAATIGDAKCYAVCRVIGIVEHGGEDGKKFRFSCKLDKKANLALMLELLDPAGGVTEAGSQKYRASGVQLPKVAPGLILRTLELRHLEGLAQEGDVTRDALMNVEDILSLKEKGYTRLTMADGHLHAQNAEEELADHNGMLLWNAVKSPNTCYFCESQFYDDSTGIIIQCQTCHKHWHQECHAPKIPIGEDTVNSWLCGVCSGADKDVCTQCGDYTSWPLRNNSMVFCEGGCEQWWHQQCLNPVLETLPDGAWICEPCTANRIAEREAEAEREHQEAAAGAAAEDARRKGRRPRKCKVAPPLPQRVVISDRATAMQRATWNRQGDNHGSTKKRQKFPGRGLEGRQVGELVNAKYKSLRGVYPAIVTAVHSDGTCDLQYQDGSEDVAEKVALNRIFNRAAA
jgi:hypothetical protein